MRDNGRQLECQWRERADKLRAAKDEPQCPADAHDDNPAREVYDDTLQRLTPADIRFYAKAGQTNAIKRPARAARNAKAEAKSAVARGRRGNHTQQPRGNLASLLSRHVLVFTVFSSLSLPLRVRSFLWLRFFLKLDPIDTRPTSLLVLWPVFTHVGGRRLPPGLRRAPLIPPVLPRSGCRS